MVITLLILALDCAVMALNQQALLQYHAVFIAILVVRLWRYNQPPAYVINEAALRRMRQEGRSGLEERIGNSCTVCLAIKPARYYHCRRCERCIYRMDHHCSWVGNCIGHYNAKVYLHLLLHVFIHCLALLAITVANYSHLLDYSRYQIYYLLTIVPVIYGLFESQRLIREFSDSVENNQTLIQSYKGVVGHNVHFMHNWTAYMGRNPASWLIPTFIKLTNCDLLQPTFSEDKEEETKEYVYADEYMYGSDDDEEFQELMKQE